MTGAKKSDHFGLHLLVGMGRRDEMRFLPSTLGMYPFGPDSYVLLMCTSDCIY
jgi:hypothetical protein